ICTRSICSSPACRPTSVFAFLPLFAASHWTPTPLAVLAGDRLNPFNPEPVQAHLVASLSQPTRELLDLCFLHPNILNSLGYYVKEDQLLVPMNLLMKLSPRAVLEPRNRRSHSVLSPRFV